MSKIRKRLWQNPEYAKKKMLSFSIRPNEPEKKLIKIIDSNNFPLKYTGDGTTIIHGLCPDFIEKNGKKKIVELFGDYWHDSNRRKLKSYQTPRGRRAFFFKYGFDLLIVWEHELINPELVQEKISNFLEVS